MNVSSQYEEVTRELRPRNIAMYLRSNGWKKASEKEGKYSVWIEDSADENEVIVPSRPDFADYPLRVSQLLNGVAKKEKRDYLSVLNDIFSHSADVVSIAVSPKGSSSGTIPLGDGVNLITKVRDLFLAAACTTIDPRSSYLSRKPPKANDYVDRLKLGQTARGSYVVNVVSPIAPAVGEAIEDPFERKVNTKLASALRHLLLTTDNYVETGDNSSLTRSISDGINSNLCESVVGLAGGAEDPIDVKVDFKWSGTRPIPTAVPSSFVIPKDAIPTIFEIGRYFRETSPRENFQLEGVFVSAERRDENELGTLKAIGIVDETTKIVRVVDLPKGLYDIGLDAHKNFKRIRCSGTLAKDGRTYKLSNVSRIRVLEDDEDSIEDE